MKITVTVHSGASKRTIINQNDLWHIYTFAKPEKGLANTDVIKQISEYFSVPKSKIKIITGQKSKQKIIDINV